MASEEDDLLADAREVFQQCEEREDENRREALDDIKFARIAEQWHEKDRKQREEDGRPCLTINRMPAFIRQVVNDARQNSPSITVHPVDSNADVKTAEIYSGLIRDIERQSDADTAYDTAIEFAVTGGFGYFRINTEYASDDTFEQDIRIRRIANPFSVYGDPFSDAADSSDWNVAFVMDKLKKKDFEKRFPDAEMTDWDSDFKKDWGDCWYDGDMVGVAEYWTREQTKRQIVALSSGEIVDLKEYETNKALFDAAQTTVIGSPRSVLSHKVTQRLMTGAEVLETTEWAGRYIPIVPVYGDEVNVEGKRYLRSLIRDAKDPQRMFNYWRTASTELVALAPKAPFIGPKGSFKTDAAKWGTANRSSHAYIEYDPVPNGQPPQRQPFPGVPAGAIQEALNAADDMKAIMGMYDASLGAASNETSGRAILMRQREGDVSTFHFIDNLSRAIRHGGRILIDLIPKVYSTPRIVRTLGMDGKSQSVPINQPAVQVRNPTGDGQSFVPLSSLPQDVQQKAESLAKVFDLTAGKYDLAVEAGPSFTTQREEAANQMMELIRIYPQAAPVIGDLVVENLDWLGAAEIAKRLKAMLPPNLQNADGQDGSQPQQPQDPMQHPAIQALVQQGTQQIQQLSQQLNETQQALTAEQQDKTLENRKLDIDQYKAETDRMKAVHEVTKPSASPAQQVA